MYAVIKTGGKQYAVEQGDRLFIERLDVEQGAKIEFDRVLYLNADDSIKVGTPYLDAVRVIGTVIENGKGKKVIIYKYKAKKDYRKKQGHRQPYTLVEINDIRVNGKSIGKLFESAPEAPEQMPSGDETAAEASADDSLAGAADTVETSEAAAVADATESEVEIPATVEVSEAAKLDGEASEAEKAEAEKPERPAVKRTAKPKAEKLDAKAETAGTAIEKPAAKRTTKPKAEKSETKAELGAEKPAAKRTAKPKDAGKDAAPATSEEE
jgi:large subunit ribosomal protein L21